MDWSTPGLPVPHHLPEFSHVHVHWVGDAIQPSHALPPSSPLPSVFLWFYATGPQSSICKPGDCTCSRIQAFQSFKGNKVHKSFQNIKSSRKPFFSVISKCNNHFWFIFCAKTCQASSDFWATVCKPPDLECQSQKSKYFCLLFFAIWKKAWHLVVAQNIFVEK